ncbi:MAG: hypothetical protein V2I33_24085 [Kangiellaceae bacterium]|nr:hypothetical protein [Kangiellaceae bacterium]
MVRLQNLAATPLPNLLSNATFGAAAALHAPANPKTPRPFLDATTHHGLEEMQTLELKKLEVQINT